MKHEKLCKKINKTNVLKKNKQTNMKKQTNEIRNVKMDYFK